MENSEYRNWKINYISCEGNERWTVAECPAEWDVYEVTIAFRGICYGVGDDPAEFVSCDVYYNQDRGEATYFFDESNLEFNIF